MLDIPYDKAVQACEGLDQSPPSCYEAAPSSWWRWWPAADDAHSGCSGSAIKGTRAAKRPCRCVPELDKAAPECP